MTTEAALRHLNNLKPNETWSVDWKLGRSVIGDKKRRVILKRRNIPLLDKTDFSAIAYDLRSGCVVGLPSDDDTIGVVLVEKHGSICRNGRVIPIAKSKLASSPAGIPTSSSTTTTARSRDGMTSFSDEENSLFLKYALYALGAAVLFKIFAQAFASAILGLSIVIIPLIGYACITRPPISSFDAKKELKRVLRGHHLPEDHPDKPKGWFRKTAAKIGASVATELATSVGYEVAITDMVGVAHLAKVTLDASQIECYWIGAFHKWWFLMQRDVSDNN